MCTNIGTIDRLLRFILGVIILSGFFWLSQEWQMWSIVGVIPLITAFVKFCPAYWLLKIRTDKS